MSQSFSNGYAVLIGVNENSVAKWALPDVARDVAALQQVLTHPERCAYPHENVKVILGRDATRQGILDGLEWLGERLRLDTSGNATAVVYYSGHGWRDEATQPAQYYLIPYDVKEVSIPARALRAGDFAAEVGALNPRRLLVILDACHSGGMEVKNLESQIGSNLAAGYLAAAIPLYLLMGSMSGVEKAITPGEGAKGLESLAQGSGRAVLSSSQGNQSSYIRKDRAMSIFTYHLIEALTGHAQPQVGAKEVLVSDVMSHVWRRVPESARQEWSKVQQPDYQVSGNFPVALLLGGQGLSKGVSAPDPLKPPASLASSTRIYTGGGTYIGGNVNTGGGDFVGRDKVVYGDEVRGDKVAGDKITVGNITGSTGIAIGRGAQAKVNYGADSSQEIEQLFQPILQAARKASPAVQAQAVRMAEELKHEAAKGKAANDKLMGKLLEGLVGLVPAAVSAVVSAFASPILAGVIGPVTGYMLDNIQDNIHDKTQGK